MSQPQLLILMRNYLQKKYNKITMTKEYLIAEGELPIALVAHLDTVGPTPPRDIYYDKEHGVMWSPQLLGADDRAGVYAIIQLVELGFRPHIILTTDEEIGARGAQAIVRKNPECPLENLKAIIQLDRRGNQDCVFYDCDNRDFVDFISSFGFTEAEGTFSDISILGPAWRVAAVNLSCGYYNEHSVAEILKVRELDSVIAKVGNILSVAHQMPKFGYIEKKIVKMWGLGNECLFCGIKGKKKDFKNIQENGYLVSVCENCYNQYYLI